MHNTDMVLNRQKLHALEMVLSRNNIFILTQCEIEVCVHKISKCYYVYLFMNLLFYYALCVRFTVDSVHK